MECRVGSLVLQACVPFALGARSTFDSPRHLSTTVAGFSFIHFHTGNVLLNLEPSSSDTNTGSAEVMPWCCELVCLCTWSSQHLGLPSTAGLGLLRAPHCCLCWQFVESISTALRCLQLSVAGVASCPPPPSGGDAKSRFA